MASGSLPNAVTRFYEQQKQQQQQQQDRQQLRREEENAFIPRAATQQQQQLDEQQEDGNNNAAFQEESFYNSVETDHLIESNLRYVEQLRREAQNVVDGETLLQQQRHQSQQQTAVAPNNLSTRVRASVVDPEVLIELVRQYPCLWNTKLNVYRDQIKKKKAWEIISASLNGAFTVDVLKNKWKLIRDSYSRCMHKREEQTRSGAAVSKLAKCRNFEALSFLRSAVSSNESDSNVDDSLASPEMSLPISQHSNRQSIDDSLTRPEVSKRRSIESDDDETSSITSRTSSRTEPYYKPTSTATKRKKKLASDVDVMLINSLKDVSAVCSNISKPVEPTPTNVREEKNDADHLFCMSLIPVLKSLPAVKNRQARLKIQEVLFKIEFGEDLQM
ncbi:uncharacterized protein LOC130615750 [Hydractinia symbiolongicarpus]|uniref:uncharacterized protein LOC130615750 n=1 Tax=Hydractinia symbiolongicarpus TaxID=13093 RepID=UPI0025507254|nr:uncharacterized protein LOC130615750 [Hydractinia symbiolongicarpus]